MYTVYLCTDFCFLPPAWTVNILTTRNLPYVSHPVDGTSSLQCPVVVRSPAQFHDNSETNASEESNHRAMREWTREFASYIPPLIAYFIPLTSCNNIISVNRRLPKVARPLDIKRANIISSVVTLPYAGDCGVDDFDYTIPLNG